MEVTNHPRHSTFRMAEVAILRNLFRDILWPIAELCPPPKYEAHLDHNQSPIQHGAELYGPRSIDITSLVQSCKTPKLKQSESPILGRLGNVGLKVV
jgi:hypothetical protein